MIDLWDPTEADIDEALRPFDRAIAAQKRCDYLLRTKAQNPVEGCGFCRRTVSPGREFCGQKCETEAALSGLPLRHIKE